MIEQHAAELSSFTMAPHGVTWIQAIHLPDLIEFNNQKRVRKKLFEGAQLWAEVVCYEPGQGTPVHYHPKEDELFLTLRGHGIIEADGKDLDAFEESMITVPATVKHGMRNEGPDRWVVVFVKMSRAYGKSTEGPASPD